MSNQGTQADSTAVDTVARGQAIRRRRMALGIRSVSEMARRSGVSRSAATAAEHGEGARGTYERLEAWLSAQEAGEGEDVPMNVPALEQLTLRAEGEDWKFTVSGPIADRERLKADLLDLVQRHIRGEG